MPKLSDYLQLAKCPHCSVANPTLQAVHNFESRDHAGGNERRWRIYVCRTCGNVVSAWATNYNQEMEAYYPTSPAVDSDLPERARAFLQQAHDSVHAPSGAVMLAASAVDAMLKQKQYKTGSLYARIDQAVADHLITEEMGTWAHDIRLDANDERHADEDAQLPTAEDARRAIDFASALGQFLFVLPARVKRGLKTKTGAPE